MGYLKAISQFKWMRGLKRIEIRLFIPSFHSVIQPLSLSVPRFAQSITYNFLFNFFLFFFIYIFTTILFFLREAPKSNFLFYKKKLERPRVLFLNLSNLLLLSILCYIFFFFLFFNNFQSWEFIIEPCKNILYSYFSKLIIHPIILFEIKCFVFKIYIKWDYWMLY